MKRTLILIFLCVCILTTSLLAKFGLSQKYLMRPYAYFERITTVFDNMPTADSSDIKFNVLDDEEYIQPEIDSLEDFFIAIPIFWNNLCVMVKNIVSLFTNFFTYVGKTISNVFKMKGYITTVFMSFVPLDWEKMQDDNVDVKLFFFGHVKNIPFSKYYGVVEDEDIDKPTPPATGGSSGPIIIPDFGIGDGNIIL